MTEETPEQRPGRKHRRPLGRLLLMALPLALAAAVMWGRSHFRRDAVVWETDAGGRRLACRLVSGGGRVTFVSYSRPAAAAGAGAGVGAARAPSFVTGDYAATDPMAQEVELHTQQAGVLDTNLLGLAYSQHRGDMASGRHVWTAALVPWWLVAALVLAAPVINRLFPARSRRGRRRGRWNGRGARGNHPF